MKRWHFWFGVLISLVFIFIALSQVEDWAVFGQSLKDADYRWLALIVASYFLTMFVRAVRWRYILNQSGRTGLGNVFAAILVCYMGNNVFPLRAGEIMRVFLIGKLEPSVSYSEAMASVVVERLFDFLVMLLFLAVVLIVMPFPEKYADLHRLVQGFGAATLIGAVVLFAFLLLLYARTEAMMPWIEALLKLAPESVREKTLAAIRRFAAGLVIMGRPRALFAVTAMGLVIWAVNLLPVWFTGLAFGLKIDVAGAMFIGVVGAAAASIPAAPGFIGTFHTFNQQALLFLFQDLDAGKALSFAIVLHACYYFPITVAGALAGWAKGYSMTRLRQEAEEEQAGEAGEESDAGRE